MAKFPALPLFTDAFIADTVHLTAQQTGAFLMLLMIAWRSPDCILPDDDKILARYARMDLRAWKANKEVIMSFWKKNKNGEWYQARLLDERKYVEDKRNINVRAGKASALKRHNTTSTPVVTEAQPKFNEPTPHPKRKKEPPDGVPPKMHFEGHVLRLTVKDRDAWLGEFGLSPEQLDGLLCERDDFLKKLSESDNRRSRWWMPTKKWISGESQNLKKSKGQIK